MKDCKKFEKLIAGALYGELSPREQNLLDKHLEECPECALHYREMKSALRIMDQREREAPPERFWETFAGSVENRLRESDASEKQTPPLPTTGRIFQSVPQWSYRLAAAVLLLSLGIFIGKYYFGGSRTVPREFAQRKNKQETFTRQAAVQDRAYHYLEKSKILLLGIVNMDTVPDDSSDYDFTRQSEAARTLIRQSAVLKDDLVLTRQRKLYALVSDLEMILLEIANLEAESDLSAVDMIRTGVDRKALLLKINLEEILKQNRESSGQLPPPDESKKKAI